MRTVVALPYANPHLGLFYQWVQNRFETDFYVFGDVRDHRSHFNLEQTPLHIVDKNTVSQNIRKGLYTVIFMHGMFYPETLFLLTAKRSQIVILTEPIAPGKRSFVNQIYKKLVAKRFASRHHVSLLLLGPLSAQAKFIQLAGKSLFSTGYGYFPAVAPIANTKDVFTQPIEIIFAGQFIERKNIEAIIAASALSESVQNGKCRITLIGDGPLKQAVVDAPNVHYFGFADNPTLLSQLCHADILLLPSKYDGWGAIVNEAAACGCMVMLSKQVMASSTLLIENETGIYVSEDAATLAQQIDHLCNNPLLIQHMKTGMHKHYASLLQIHDSILDNHLAHATTTTHI